MSECRWIMPGPPEGWTRSDIKGTCLRGGLVELPDVRQKLQKQVDSQLEAAKTYGMYDERIKYLAQLYDQLAGDPIAFHKPDCFRHEHCGDRAVCLMVWRTPSGNMSDQCNACTLLPE